MQNIIQAGTGLRCRLILLRSPTNTGYATKENSEMENIKLINVQVSDFPVERKSIIKVRLENMAFT